MVNEIDKIKSIVNSSDFIKGRTYPSYYIDYIGVEQKNNNNVFHFEVESERTYDIYKVTVEGIKNNINKVSCSCPQFRGTNSCKHVAACLINYKDEILNFDPKERLLNISSEILKYFKPKM